jgi:hypothetical protein
VDQLATDGVLHPTKAKGDKARMYPLIETLKALFAHQDKIIASRSTSKDALAEADLVKRTLEIRKLETQTAIAEGRVHTTEDVERVMNDMLGAFRVRLWGVPLSIADRLIGLADKNAVVDILEAEIASVCGLLSDYDPEMFYARNPDYMGEVNMSEENGEAVAEAAD